MYSIDPDEHDRVTRTPGSQRRTLAAIDRVVARGLVLRVSVIVIDQKSSIQELIDHLHARGVKYVNWTRTFSVGRGEDVAEGSHHVEVTTTVEVGGAHASATPSAAGAAGAPMPSGKLCITYDGDIVPCIFQRSAKLGNVRDGKLLDVITAHFQARRSLPLATEAAQRLQCSSSPHGRRARRARRCCVTKLRVRRGLTIRPLPDGDAVVARSEGADAVIVNTTAHAILELLAQEGTEQEIADEFCRSFPGENTDAPSSATSTH